MKRRSTRDMSSAEAVRHIRRNGDTLDADPRRRHRVTKLGRMAAVAAGTFPYFAVGSYASYVENYIAPIVTVAAVGGASYVSRRAVTKHRTKKAEVVQNIVRSELDEPVDIIRVKPSRKRSDVVLRWYGLDGVESDGNYSGDMTQRAAAVAEFARTNGVDTVVIGTPIDDDTAKDGSEYISTKKRLPWVDIEDDTASERVKELTPDELERYVEDMMSERDDSILTNLVQRIDNEHLTELCMQYTADHDDTTLAAMKRAARAAIERHVESTEVIREHSSDGVPERRRCDVVAQVSDGIVHRIGTSPASDATREPAARYLESVSVTSMAGFPDYARLRQALDDPEHIADCSMQAAWASLYSLIHARDIEAAQTAEARSTDESDEIDDATLFERIGDAAGKLELSDGSVHRKRRAVRSLAAIALAVLPAGAGAAAGIAYNNAANSSIEQLTARCTRYYGKNHVPLNEFDCDPEFGAKFPKFRKHTHGSQMEYDEALIRGQTSLSEYQTGVPAYIAQFLVEHVGIPDAAFLSSVFQGQQADQQLQKALTGHGAPPDMYTKDIQNSIIGDVTGKSNEVVYSIQPLHGQSSVGYWPTQQFNQIDVAQGQSGVFHGKSIRFSYDPHSVEGTEPTTVSLSLPFQSEAIRELHPDYEIETPYIDVSYSEGGISSGSVALPVKAGYEVVGAQYVDKANLSDVAPVFFINQNGVAPSAGAANPGAVSRMRDPVLRYWIKKKSNVGTLPTSRMEAASPNGNQLSTADLRMVAKEVRRSLGLPETASAEQVLQAVRDGHTYAYTPFERQQIDTINLSKKNSVQVLEAVGGVLAELKSYNCNLASAEYLLATLDDPSKRALAVGFHDTDGSHDLTTQEAHAWTIDDEGQIIDPTPVHMAPGVVRRTKVDKTPPPKQERNWTLLDLVDERNAGLALGAIGLAVAWKKRRKFAKVLDTTVVNGLFRTKTIQQAVDHRIHELYAAPTSPYVSASSNDRISVSDTVQKYVNNIPPDSQVRFAKAIDGSVRRHAARS